MAQNSSKSHDQMTVEHCQNLDPEQRDKCYHDLAKKHRKAAPSKEPVFDDDGNLIFFQDAPVNQLCSSDEPRSHPDLIGPTSNILAPQSNVNTKRSKIKFKQLPNGENIITIEKEGDLSPFKSHFTSQNVLNPDNNSLNAHLSPLSAHNIPNQHDEESSEIFRESNDSSEIECRRRKKTNFSNVSNGFKVKGMLRKRMKSANTFSQMYSSSKNSDDNPFASMFNTTFTAPEPVPNRFSTILDVNGPINDSASSNMMYSQSTPYGLSENSRTEMSWSMPKSSNSSQHSYYYSYYS